MAKLSKLESLWEGAAMAPYLETARSFSWSYHTEKTVGTSPESVLRRCEFRRDLRVPTQMGAAHKRIRRATLLMTTSQQQMYIPCPA